MIFAGTIFMFRIKTGQTSVHKIWVLDKFTVKTYLESGQPTRVAFKVKVDCDRRFVHDGKYE